jgi:hypothetical protein
MRRELVVFSLLSSALFPSVAAPDPDHCGGCGNPCGTEQRCAGGTCVDVGA